MVFFVRQISWEEYDELAKGNHILIDVRTPEEWSAGHAEGAIHIPLRHLLERVREVAPDSTTAVITCCNSGGRAGRACEALHKLGYTNARYIAGLAGQRYQAH